MKNVFLLCCVCFALLLIIAPCLSEILVVKKGSNKTTEIIGDLPALFGPSLPLGGLQGSVVYTSPPDACVPLARPPSLVGYEGPFVALVRRYNCTFVEKVLNAQVAGYQGVIVRNVGSDQVEAMSGTKDTELVLVPAVFVGESDGILIQDYFQYDSSFYVIVTDDLPFNIQNYLLPFAITIGVCFILMLTLMLVKCVRDYRRSRRHRLSSRALRKLPLRRFRKGHDPYECCAVCLEDYVDKDKIRILPCNHAYHSKCIDPWLTKSRRVCPVCKRKVVTGEERASDLESDSDNDDEATPLVRSEAGTTQGGTFVHQRENPFRQAERILQQQQQQQQPQQPQQQEEEEGQEAEPERERKRKRRLGGGPGNYSRLRRGESESESDSDSGDQSASEEEEGVRTGGREEEEEAEGKRRDVPEVHFEGTSPQAGAGGRLPVSDDSATGGGGDGGRSEGDSPTSVPKRDDVSSSTSSLAKRDLGSTSSLPKEEHRGGVGIYAGQETEASLSSPAQKSNHLIV